MQTMVALPDVPYMTPAAFAAKTGQTEGSVKEQLKQGQLPAYPMPPSPKAKDPHSPKRTKYVDTGLMAIESARRAGLQIMNQS